MKKALAVLLFGAVLLLGSCVPYGVIAWRSFNAPVVYEQDVAAGETVTTEPVQVNTGTHIQPALTLTIHTEAIETRKHLDEHEHAPQYQFPLQYTVMDEQGGVVFEDSLVLDNRGTRYNIHEWSTDTGARLRYEKTLAKLRPPASGQIRIRMTIRPDDIYHARLEAAQLRVYDKVYTHGALFGLGIGMGIIGILLLIGGLVGTLVSGTSPAMPGPAPPPASPPQHPPPPVASGSQRYAGLLHLAGLLSHLIPLGGLIAQLVMWLVKKDEDVFINTHGVNAVNFRLSMLLYKVIAVALIFTILLLPLAVLALAALAILDIVFVIIAAMAAFEGRNYTYPLAIRFVK